MIPGIYGMFPTSDGWIAIVGVAGPARDLFYRTIGRPDLIAKFDQLLYFEDDRAALWPILDEIFAQKPTAEWCRLLEDAGLRFAPVRDHAEVAADPGVRANGYITRVTGSDEGTIRGKSSVPQFASLARCRRPSSRSPSSVSTPKRFFSRTDTPGTRSRPCRRTVPSSTGRIVCPSDAGIRQFGGYAIRTVGRATGASF